MMIQNGIKKANPVLGGLAAMAAAGFALEP